MTAITAITAVHAPVRDETPRAQLFSGGAVTMLPYVVPRAQRLITRRETVFVWMFRGAWLELLYLEEEQLFHARLSFHCRNSTARELRDLGSGTKICGVDVWIEKLKLHFGCKMLSYSILGLVDGRKDS